MKKGIFKIISNDRLTDNVYRMKIEGDTAALTVPGQFINIALDGLYLRRPISVYDWDENTISVIYKVVGKGTALMSNLAKGKKLDILTGLGNGYDILKSGRKPLLIGGGVGVPPMYGLAKCLLRHGIEPVAILGFNKKDEIFAYEDFKKLGIETIITTVDGSSGMKGFVTDGMRSVPDYTYFYTCGPEPMLKAVYQESVTSGQFSFEERMGCGFGACMGCTCKTKYGNKRICKDGPVLVKEEIIW